MPSVIWLVDDDAAFSSLATEVAERVGVALVVMSRDAAADCDNDRLPDRVIIDGEVFRASGSRSLTTTPALPRYVDIADRVLVCTAYLDDDLDAERISDPRIRLLRKPFNLDEFEAALAWLDSGHVARQAVDHTASRSQAFSIGGAWAAPRTSVTAAAE